jgi:hypothetical protein
VDDIEEEEEADGKDGVEEKEDGAGGEAKIDYKIIKKIK